MIADDAHLVRRMLAGDERAFEEFFADCFPGLFRFALSRMGRDADAAEEVVQSALSKAVTKLDTYRGEAALFTWLCTFCRYEISAYFRRAGRRREAVELVEDDPEVAAALASLACSPVDERDERQRRGEIARRVHVTLDSLPPRYADALEWKYVDGLPVRDIASRLGLSPKAAESLLGRARAAFRDGFSALAARPALATAAEGR